MKTLITIIAIFLFSCNSSDDDDGLFLTKVNEQQKADSLAKVHVIVKK